MLFMEEPTFGDPQRHYSRQEYTPNRSVHQLRQILERQDPELKTGVEAVCKQYNQVIREQVRKETGLSLSHEGKQRSIYVKVEDGIPVVLGNVLDKLFDPILWDLLIHREQLKNARDGLRYLVEKYEQLRSAPPIPGLPGLENIQKDKNYLQELIDRLDQIKLPEKIMGIEEDTLGAYYFRRGEVHLYWMVIGLVSKLCDLPIRELTLITLTHELTHAYTHLGFDIDGTAWSTKDFAFASLFIVEGLAQYYTRQIGLTLKERFPEMNNVFKIMLSSQPKPYTDFLSWSDENTASDKEVVRLSMLASRLRGIRNYEMFKEELSQARQRLAAKNTQMILGLGE